LDFDTLRSLRARNQGTRRWYEMRNLAQGEAEIFIYDFIGWDPFFGGVSANDFVRELRGINAPTIHLRINSPGGDIAEAVTIRNALEEHPAAIQAHIDGAAWSAAAWVGLLTKPNSKVTMSPHSTMMIHEPWNVIAGNAEEMAKEAAVLEKFGNEIAEILSEKAGGKAEDWRAKMREETWYTDQEAVDAGLADEVAGAAASAENRRFNPAILNLFKNVPDYVTDAPASNDEARKAELEFLRDQSRRVGVLVGR